MSSAVISFDASVAITKATNKACASMASDFSLDVVRVLAEMYKFDADDAIRSLGLSAIAIKKIQKKSASASASTKTSTKKEPKTKWETPACILPWCGIAFPNQDFCQGLRLNHGLHSQCTMKSLEDSKYCSTCHKQSKKNDTNKPTYGDVEMRMQFDLLEYREPKSNKQTIPFANVMEKLAISAETAKAEATKFGVEIPVEHFVLKKTQRGRPKKATSAIDSDDENKPKARRGRPKKEKKVIESNTGDDLIASLVAQASNASEEVSAPIPVKSKKKSLAKSSDSGSESDSDGTKKTRGRPKKELTEEEILARKQKRKEAAKKRRAEKKAAFVAAYTESEDEAEAYDIKHLKELSKTTQSEINAAKSEPQLDSAINSESAPVINSDPQLDSVVESKPAPAVDAELQHDEVFDAETEEEETDDEDALQVKAVTINGVSYLQEVGSNTLFDPESQEQIGNLESDGTITSL